MTALPSLRHAEFGGSEAELSAALERYRALASNLPGITVFLFDHDLRYVLADGTTLGFGGLTKARLEGSTIWDLLPADLCERLAPRYRAALAGESLRFEDEFAGHVFDVQLIPLRDASGRVTLGMGVSHDVTAQRAAQARLAENETRLRAIIEAEPECVKLLDREGRLLEMNPAGLAMVEADGIEQVRGIPISTVIAPEHRAAFDALNRRVLAGESGVLEFEIVGLKGTRRWMATHAVPLRDAQGGVQAVLGITRDITERKRAEEQLRASRAALRRLAMRGEKVREDERTRIAREIHDRLGQSLTALKFELTAARDAAARGEAGVAERLHDTARLADDLVKNVRRIATDLRPPILDELGLADAVDWLAQDFARRTGIACDTTIAAGVERLRGEVATTLFRILQEALANVLRHAHAGRVDVRLETQDGLVMLAIADDGRGITEPEATGPLALGILGMRERASALGGALEVMPATAAGRGTRVAAWLPVARDARV